MSIFERSFWHKENHLGYYSQVKVDDIVDESGKCGFERRG